MVFKLFPLAFFAAVALLLSQTPAVLGLAPDNNDLCEEWAEKGECDTVSPDKRFHDALKSGFCFALFTQHYYAPSNYLVSHGFSKIYHGKIRNRPLNFEEPKIHV